MLALWVFTLASGLANACLLEDPAHASRQPTVDVSHAHGAFAASGHVEAIDHHSDDNSKAPCLKACDEGAQALQSNAGVDLADPGPPPLVAVVWSPALVALTLLRVADPQPPLADPPERIRYSRWAL